MTMATKMNTKTWADPATTGQRDTRPDQALTDQEKKMMGGQSLETLLNKAADPNYVDESKKVRGTGSAELNKDAFFKLMLAQLKNQDPTNPLKNHEMAAQLAQFSTLEQMSNMNQTLTKMENKNSDPQNFQALNLIGKTVQGDSSRVTRSQFDKEHEFNFNAPQELSEATIKVFNNKGEMMKEFKMNNVNQGANKVSWNGMNEAGEKAPAGDYLFQIEAKNKQGQKVAVKTEFEGTISGLSFSAEGPVLQVGQQSIKMRDVRQITDPSVKNNDQKVNDLTSMDLKKPSEAQHNLVKKDANTSANAQAKPQGASDVMTDVAMSRETMNDLMKAGSDLGKSQQKVEQK
jgi:flagellar basal-body rod modification protein FlgD